MDAHIEHVSSRYGPVVSQVRTGGVMRERSRSIWCARYFTDVGYSSLASKPFAYSSWREVQSLQENDSIGIERVSVNNPAYVFNVDRQ